MRFYWLNPKKLVDLQSGILFSELSKLKYSQNYIYNALQKYNISTTKPLIFSLGRSEIYKGFHLLIDACKKLNNISFQLVILCPPYSKWDAFFKSIKDQLKKSNIDYILIDKVDFELISIIAQWKMSKIIATLSLKEPFGLIPSQVRVLSRTLWPVILTSNKDGYREQIIDDKDWFITNLWINTIANKIRYIFNLDQKKIQKIKRQWFKRVIKFFDYQKNVYLFLSKMF